MGGAMTWVSERHLVAAISNARRVRRHRLRRDDAAPCSTPRSPRPTPSPTGRSASTSSPFTLSLLALIDVCVGRKRRATSCWPARCPVPPRSPASRTAARSSCASRRRSSIAKKLVRMGADAIVIEGMEAGGHIGPVSTERPGAGDPAASARGAGLRRRRHRPRRGDPRLSRNGRVGRAARHALRLRARIDRPSALQAGLHPRQRARRGAIGAARSALPGDPGARARQRRHARIPRAAARRDRPLQPRRAVAKRSAARDRAFLGGRLAPRGHRRRCRARLAHGRPERRHGDARAIDPRDPRRAGRPGGVRARRARGAAPKRRRPAGA